MDYRVALVAAIPVYDVETEEESIQIAISKVGEMLNPDMSYVEIEPRETHCPHCDERLSSVHIVAGKALVALELEMTVFNVDEEEHAERIARKEIGQNLDNIPLELSYIEVEVEDNEEEDSETEDVESDVDEESAEE